MRERWRARGGPWLFVVGEDRGSDGAERRQRRSGRVAVPDQRRAGPTAPGDRDARQPAGAAARHRAGPPTRCPRARVSANRQAPRCPMTLRTLPLPEDPEAREDLLQHRVDRRRGGAERDFGPCLGRGDVQDDRAARAAPPAARGAGAAGRDRRVLRVPHVRLKTWTNSPIPPRVSVYGPTSRCWTAGVYLCCSARVPSLSRTRRKSIWPSPSSTRPWENTWNWPNPACATPRRRPPPLDTPPARRVLCHDASSGQDLRLLLREGLWARRG